MHTNLHTPDDYEPAPDNFTVAVIADMHANRPFQIVKGSRARHTRLGNGSAAGFMVLPDKVDHIVLAGDILQKPNPQLVINAALIDTQGLEHRYNPRGFMEALLKRNPNTQFHYVVGNHEGKNADDTSSEIIVMLSELRAHYPNLTVCDYAAIGNMLVCHGHQVVHNIRPRAGDALGQYEIEDVREKPGTIHQARDKHELAELMCSEVGVIRRFLDHELSHIPPGGKAHAYVYFSHTHQWFDESVTYPPNPQGDEPRLKVHVSNLGCLLPGRKANYKLAHFQNSAVRHVESLDLGKVDNSFSR